MVVTFLVFFLLALLSSETIAGVSIWVSYLSDDIASDPSNCCPVSTSLCNVRSAWLCCVGTSSDSCHINLPVDSVSLIEQDRGSLELVGAKNISIVGFGAEVRGDNSLLNNFISFNQSVRANETTFLSITDTIITGFGSGDTEGEAIIAVGNATVVLKEVHFSSCTGSLGGAIYLANNTQSITIENSSFTNCHAADSGGAILLDGMKNVEILGSTFTDCTSVNEGGSINAQSNNARIEIVHTYFVRSKSVDDNFGLGGAVYIGANNHDVAVSDVICDTCSAITGGAIYLGTGNSDIRLWNITVLDVHASVGGGLAVDSGNWDITVDGLTVLDGNCDRGMGVYVNAQNSHLIFQNITVERSYSEELGALMLVDGNQHVLFENIRVVSSSAPFAGGLYLNEDNRNVTLRNAVFSDCFAYYDGGAIYAEHGNEYVTLEDVIIHDCYAYDRGGALYAFQSNNHWRLRRLNVSDCGSTDGGGVYFDDANEDFRVSDSTFSACYADRAGGSLVLATNNIDVKITNNTIVGSVASIGAGVWIAETNNNVLLQSNTIQRCSATINGGGIYVDQYNPNLVLLGNIIVDNTAGTSGGGIFLNQDNTALVLAGGIIANNSAAQNGGGVYVCCGHTQLKVVDELGFQTSTTLQSEHPYQSKYPYAPGHPRTIYNHTVSVPEASGFVINFDPLTNVNEQDTLLIYADASLSTVLFRHTGTQGWPGVDLPSLQLVGSTFFVSFIGNPLAYRYTHYSDGFYGFTLYVTPVIAVPAAPVYMHGNAAGLKGGGVYLFGSNPFVVLSNLILERNSAGEDGGAVYTFLSNTGLNFVHSTLTRNTAGNGGAGLVVSAGHFAVQVSDCTFAHNAASSIGGGIVAGNANGQGNFGQGSAVVFRRCALVNNTAVQGAGASVGVDNSVEFVGCVFRGNVAGADGGGLWIGSENSVRVTSGNFSSNRAHNIGAGLYSSYNNDLTLAGSVFTKNQAGFVGGALSVTATRLQFANTSTFSGNIAEGAGGAIANQFGPLWTMATGAQLVVTRSVADRGSALYFRALEVGSGALQHLTLQGNVARVGGTVYWLYDTAMRAEPPGMDDPTVLWVGNIAAYGIRAATQAVSLLGPTVYTVQVYLQVLAPAIEYTMLDFYAQRIPLNDTTRVVPIIASDSNAATCDSINPSIAGNDVLGVLFYRGTAAFTALQAFCFPQGKMTLKFEAYPDEQLPIDPSEAAQYALGNRTELHFRACVTGEVIRSGVCTPCVQGSYSLAAEVTTTTSCTACGKIKGVSTCSADELVLTAGYWRRYDTSNAVQHCPYALSGCAGGALTGDAQCSEGYEGPLCAVCSEGYFPNGRTCTSCDGKTAMSPLAAIYLAILVVLCVGVVGYLYHRFTALSAEESGAAETAQDSAAPSTEAPAKSTPRQKEKNQAAVTQGEATTTVDRVLLWIQAHSSEITVKLKIVVATYQIVIATPYVLSVTLPDNFNSFLHSLGFMNLSLASLLPLQCTSSYTFIDKMIVTTLAPVVLTILLLLAFLLQMSYASYRLEQNPHRKRSDLVDQYNALKDRYLNYFFYLTYLVLPSVTTTIFQIFICTDIDPQEEFPEDENLYLAADMSISCTSSYYRKGLVYAVFMILLYPVGVPTMYGYLLYQCREEIAGRDKPLEECDRALLEPAQSVASGEENDENSAERKQAFTNNPMNFQQQDAEAAPAPVQGSHDAAKNALCAPRELSVAAARLSFLFDAYTPQFWYWELVETSRRLVLTAVLSLCGSGTSAQSVLAMLLTLVYLKIYAYFHPYAQDTADTTAEAGLYQVLFTFFGALVVMNSLLGSRWNSTVGVLLILLNLTVSYCLFYFEIAELWKDRLKRHQEPSGPHIGNSTVTANKSNATGSKAPANIEMTEFNYA